MDVSFYSLEEIAKNNGKNGNQTWIIIRNNIYDVTKFVDEHPGGSDLILEWAGKDATKGFDDAGHSSDAKKVLKQYKIGELREEDRKQKNKNSETITNNENRSVISYITCGLCG